MGRIRSARSLELSRRVSIPVCRRAFGCYLAFALLTLGACGEANTDDPTAVPCPKIVALKVTAEPLQRLGIDRWATVTEEERRAGFVGAEAFSDRKIVDLYPEIVETLGDEGYVFLGGDNEGFEAEISFKDNKERHISFALRQHPCSSERIVLQVLVQGRV